MQNPCRQSSAHALCSRWSSTPCTAAAGFPQQLPGIVITLLGRQAALHFGAPPPPNTKYTPAHLPSPAQSLPQPQCGISTHNNNRSLTSSRAGSRRTCRGPGRRWTPAGGGTSAWTTLAPALPVTPSGKPCSTALGTTSRCGRPYRRPRGGRQQTNHPGHCFSRQNGRCTRYEGMFGWCRMGS